MKKSSSDVGLCVGWDFDLSNEFTKGILVIFDEIFSLLLLLSFSSLWIVLLHEKAKHLTFPWPRDFSTPLLCSSCSVLGCSRYFQFVYFYRTTHSFSQHDMYVHIFAKWVKSLIVQSFQPSPYFYHFSALAPAMDVLVRRNFQQ